MKPLNPLHMSFLILAAAVAAAFFGAGSSVFQDRTAEAQERKDLISWARVPGAVAYRVYACTLKPDDQGRLDLRQCEVPANQIMVRETTRLSTGRPIPLGYTVWLVEAVFPSGQVARQTDRWLGTYRP